MEVALDNIAVQLPLRQRPRAMRAGVVGGIEFAIDIENREDQAALLDFQAAAGGDIVDVAHADPSCRGRHRWAIH